MIWLTYLWGFLPVCALWGWFCSSCAWQSFPTLYTWMLWSCMERQMQGSKICTVTVRSNRDSKVQKLWEWSTQLWVVAQELRPREDGEKRANPVSLTFWFLAFSLMRTLCFLFRIHPYFKDLFLVICLNLLIKFCASILSDASFKGVDSSSKNSTPFYVFSAYRPGSALFFFFLFKS